MFSTGGSEKAQLRMGLHIELRGLWADFFVNVISPLGFTLTWFMSLCKNAGLGFFRKATTKKDRK